MMSEIHYNNSKNISIDISPISKLDRVTCTSMNKHAHTTICLKQYSLMPILIESS